MTDHRATAADAAALIRDLAGATGDPLKAYATPADITAVTESLGELARHLKTALDQLAQHIERRDDWADADPAQRRRHAQKAGGKVRFAGAQARNAAEALDLAVEALGRLRPAP